MTDHPVAPLVRPDILALAPYQSGRVLVSKDSVGESAIWLDTNENPWPPYFGVGYEADCNRYPDPQPGLLIAALAELYSADQDQVLATLGSDQGIDLLVRSFCRPGQDSILVCPPTFGMYKICARIQGAGTVELPLLANQGYALDVSGILTALKTQPIKLIFIPNPTSPTGNLLDDAGLLEILAAAQGKALVVMDEAYVEFAPQNTSFIRHLQANPHLVILKTLSKAWGLAGLRCGTVIADSFVIDVLKRVIPPYPIPVPVSDLALAALGVSGRRLMQERVGVLRAERARMTAALQACPDILSVLPSATNFLFLHCRDSADLKARLLKNGLVVRDTKTAVPNSLRITLGTPEENDRVLNALGLAPAALTKSDGRFATTQRTTKETKIRVAVDLDGSAPPIISTGLGFFDHMLQQLALHGGFSLDLRCQGDLSVDAHHTVEDCALALGEALRQALGDKRGIGRYGFVLPMDESLAQVTIDLSGRPAFLFEGSFTSPMIGDVPTEMLVHFFASLADSLRMALHLSVSGKNDHHKAEACFKTTGRALRQAFARTGDTLPSSKGVL
jgi:histidinol-phosphate aminotransferase